MLLLDAEDPNESVRIPKPHPPPKKPATTTDTSGTETGSLSAATGGSSAGGSGAGGSAGASGTSGAGGSGTGTNGVAGSNLATVGPAKRKGTLVFLGFAAVAGVAIAAVSVPKRRVETPDHPLKGSLNRRINLFSHLATHPTDPAARPPRRVDDGGYVNADEVMV